MFSQLPAVNSGLIVNSTTNSQYNRIKKNPSELVLVRFDLDTQFAFSLLKFSMSSTEPCLNLDFRCRILQKKKNVLLFGLFLVFPAFTSYS